MSVPAVRGREGEGEREREGERGVGRGKEREREGRRGKDHYKDCMKGYICTDPCLIAGEHVV